MNAYFMKLANNEKFRKCRKWKKSRYPKTKKKWSNISSSDLTTQSKPSSKPKTVSQTKEQRDYNSRRVAAEERRFKENRWGRKEDSPRHSMLQSKPKLRLKLNSKRKRGNAKKETWCAKNSICSLFSWGKKSDRLEPKTKRWSLKPRRWRLSSSISEKKPRTSKKKTRNWTTTSKRLTQSSRSSTKQDTLWTDCSVPTEF